MVLKNKHVLVVGMARSGIAVARLLCLHGAKVRINDLKTEAQFEGALDELRGIKGIDWRLGEKAEDALDAGMDMLLISPGVRIDSPVVKKAQEMGIEVTGELEFALRIAHGQLIAITGTNGKTTTTTLVGEIMKNAGKVTHVVGNIGFPVSEIAQESRSSDVIVCEVSSFQLETVSEFHPNISAILNISEDHLYRHYTMENYIAHKARIFMNQSEEDTLVLNYDDPVLNKLPVEVPVKRVWFSRQQVPPLGAFVVDDSIVFGTKDDYKAVCKTNEIGIRGLPNLENALAATAIAMTAQVPAPVIRHTLRSFQGVEHRMEFVRMLDGVEYFNDSKATNIDSTVKAIAAMDHDAVIILGGDNPGVDFTELAKAILHSRVKSAVLIGDTAKQLDETLTKAGFTNFVHAGYEFEKAIDMARSMAVPGDTVMLSPACKSFDMFKDFEDRGQVFKRIVMALEEKPA